MLDTLFSNRRHFSLAKGYLDSASTSLTPRVVIDEMVRYYQVYRANVHRGVYRESVCATREYELARKNVAAFIDANPEEIIITPSATYSSNMLLRSLEEGRILPQGGNIVSTLLEHHASILPLRELATRTHYTLRTAGITETVKDILRLVDSETRIIGMTLASNVTGEILDVAQVAKEKKNALLFVDATAALGHIPVSVRELGCDALYFSSHKMLGPTGVGVLWVKGELLETLRPSVFGGHMVGNVTNDSTTWAEIPDRFEAGTPNISGVVGLGKAVEYLTLYGVEKIHPHIRALILETQERLKKIEGITLFSAPPEKNVGIVSWVMEGIHAHDVAEILSRSSVKVRAGHHCAIPLHQALGASATTRASFHLYNNWEDIAMLEKGIYEVKSIFKR